MKAKTLVSSIAAIAFLVAPAVAQPTQAECDAALIMIAEVNDAFITCGSFEAAYSNPTILALVAMDATCHHASNPLVLEKQGHENFHRLVNTLGAKQACAAFISGIELGTSSAVGSK